MTFDASYDMQAAQRRREELSACPKPKDTDRAAEEKAAKLAICLTYLAARRSGLDTYDAYDAAEAVHGPQKSIYANEMDSASADAEELDMTEKQCRDYFATERYTSQTLDDR